MSSLIDVFAAAAAAANLKEFLNRLAEFPSGNIGLWLLFIAAVGGFAFMVVDRLRRERGYIEFHNNWAAQYDVAGKKLTVTGRATVISPAAFVDATCKVKIGALSQALRFADIGRHFVIPNASVFTFVAEPFAMPGDATSARLDVTVRLSDGSKKRMRCTVPVG